MDLLDVDPDDDTAFDAWFGVMDDVARFDRPDEPAYQREELHASAVAGRARPDGSPPDDERRELLLACDAGRPVGAALLELPLADNLHTAFLTLGVHPEARRRGTGRALLTEVTRRARAAARTTLMTEVDEPPALAGRSPGRAFASASGFCEALRDVRRDLALPVPAGLLDALDDAARRRAGGYRVVQVVDRWPDALVAGRAALGAAMSTDAPLGELDWRPESWDADRVRRHEELVRRQGRRLLAAGAVHEATGLLVAFTELAVPVAAPERAFQWDTLVLRGHRGHRLGTLVKTAALRLLQREVPAARTLSTWNAESNRWMIAVNEALGFRPNGTLGEWQRRV